MIDAGSFDNTTHAVSTAACSILRVAQADTLPLKISNSFSAFTSLDWKYHLQPFLQNVSKRHSVSCGHIYTLFREISNIFIIAILFSGSSVYAKFSRLSYRACTATARCR